MTSPKARFAGDPPEFPTVDSRAGTPARADATEWRGDEHPATAGPRSLGGTWGFAAGCPLAARDATTVHDVVGGVVAAVGAAEAVGVAVGTMVVVGVTFVILRRLFGWFARPSVSVVDDQPASVLSDRDRLLLLVERHGGRMRQQEIVAQVEWSKAKVSRLLSELEEEGVLRKLRLGRENLIYLERGDATDRD